MTLIRTLLAAVTLLAACGTSLGPDEDLEPNATFRILFIGNSLTYVNDLPGMVDALADSAGLEATYATAVAYPDFALEDHWNQGDARQALERGGWKYVVMQQGPSSLPESRVNLITWTERFAPEIRAQGATPALYTVWPSIARAADFDRAVESYRLAAEAVNGVWIPAGAAWLDLLRADPTIPLYGSDGFHPSGAGTYLAAVTLIGRLYQRSAVGLPTRFTYRSGSVDLGATLGATLQQAADRANGR
jgi:hypothetical protein